MQNAFRRKHHNSAFCILNSALDCLSGVSTINNHLYFRFQGFRCGETPEFLFYLEKIGNISLFFWKKYLQNGFTLIIMYRHGFLIRTHSNKPHTRGSPFPVPEQAEEAR